MGAAATSTIRAGGAAVVISPAAGREAQDVHSRWMLVPRNIPAMEERPERLLKVRRAAGIADAGGFPHPNVRRRDEGHAAPRQWRPDHGVSGAGGQRRQGRGREDRAMPRACSSPRRPAAAASSRAIATRSKASSSSATTTSSSPMASPAALFRPLWWRTYRYIQLEIETKSEPLTIDDLRATAVGYPFERRARFESDAPELDRILDVGWRTARLCAHETYMDCPYYEQLQYVGDTRVQCLVSLFNSGDARLMRNAIELIDNSRQSDGAHHEPLSDAPGAVHPRLLAVVDRHGARLLAVCGRPRVRAPHAARRARRAQLFRELSEGERVAADAAVVALFRLGPVVAERQRAAGRGWRRRRCSICCC